MLCNNESSKYTSHMEIKPATPGIVAASKGTSTSAPSASRDCSLTIRIILYHRDELLSLIDQGPV